ncbi:SSI family serine proteinase inhibitor [Streptomyces sp. NPDC004111]|uniref:SSI family serine proteinase inhibitor n=1 Tax=Streptomyces sp. NPDC004111 TaxID=3364690 RepID=UPI0036B47C04
MSAVRTAVRRALVGTAAAAALLAGAGGASAQDTRPQVPVQAHPGNWMYLSVVEGEEAVGSLDGTLLRCPRPWKRAPELGGAHPAARKACKELNAVDGDIARIKRADVACPMIYRPVTAMAFGRWDGRRMVFSKTYPNACVMHASTGSVFKLG